MPDITSAATYDKDTAGFGSLRPNPQKRVLLFGDPKTGVAAIATTTVQYKKDNGDWEALENGTISSLPRSITIDMDADLRVVSSGSPNFNLTIRNQK